MKRSNEHIKAQREGRARDANTCCVCGSTGSPEGHHIIDFAFGGAADSDNIITLCHICHREAHNGKIDLFRF